MKPRSEAQPAHQCGPGYQARSLIAHPSGIHSLISNREGYTEKVGARELNRETSSKTLEEDLSSSGDDERGKRNIK